MLAIIKESLAVLTPIIVGGWAIWVKIIRPEVRKQKKQREEYYNKLDYVHKEMIADGNGSMKSSINYLKAGFVRVETRLDEIEGNQKVYMNLQGIAYWISNEHGDCTYASPGLCKITQRSESELMSRNWMSWIHSNDKDRIIAAWKFSIEEQTAFDEIYIMKRPGGEYIKVWAVAFPKINSANLGGKLGRMTIIEENVKV